MNLQKGLPLKDAITEEDEQAAVRNHFKEEELLERKLGHRYLANLKNDKSKKGSILGSEIPSVSKRMAEDTIIEDFKKRMEKEIKSFIDPAANE